MKTSSTVDVAQAAALVELRDRRTRRVDALAVAVALRVRQVVHDVGDDRLGRVEPERRGVADVQLEDVVALGLQPLSLEQDRTPDVVADVLQLAALSDLAHPAILTGRCLRWPRGFTAGRCDVAQGRPADPRPSRGARRALPLLPLLGARPGTPRTRRPTPAPRRTPGSRRCCASGAPAAGSSWSTTCRSGTPSTRPTRSCPGAAAFPTAPVSPDAVLLTTVHVEPAYRGGGLARMLVQGMARDLVAARRDRRRSRRSATRPDAAVAACCPVEFLGSVGFKTHRPHPTAPRMRMDLRAAISWKDEVESALERLVGVVRPKSARGPAPKATRASRWS